MLLYEEFKLYENLWEALEDNNVDNAYIDLLCSIDNSDDFIKKAQEVYETMPVNIGFKFIYPNSIGKSKTEKRHINLVKQADGTLRSNNAIIAVKDAVKTLQNAIPGASIYTTRYYEHQGNSYWRMGAHILNSDGSTNAFVLNSLIPKI